MLDMAIRLRRAALVAAAAMVCGLVAAGCGVAAPSPSTASSPAEPSPSSSAAPAASASLVPSASQPGSSPDGAISGLFDIGERSLFLECRGSGSPTVIFLAGSGASRTDMRGIEDQLDDVRVCDYDRANEGRSDPTPQPQSDLDVVDDLAALLETAAVPPPYVLAGQSVGGDQAWLYASRHPTGVAGFLMMNAGFWVLDWDELKGALTDEEIAAERANSEANLAAEKQAATPPEGVPYVVMMSTITQCGTPGGGICHRIYPFYEAWARDLAERTPTGRFVQVDASHEIYRDQPEAVLEELRRLLGEVR